MNLISNSLILRVIVFLPIPNNLAAATFLPLVNLIEETGGIISDWRGNQLSLKSAGNVVASISKKAHSDFIKISKTI